MNPIIQIEKLYASYDKKTVLSHVDLTVYEKDFLGISGRMEVEKQPWSKAF